MRLFVLLATAAMAIAGCIEPGDATGGGDGDGRANADAAPCPGTVERPPRAGRAVEVQVANNMEGATCARVYFDGTLVAAGELEGEHPALHNDPAPLATFEWDAASVVVRVEDALTGRAHEETVALQPDATWVAVWIGETGFTVRTFEEAPAYV